MTAPQILIGAILHETNTFNRVPTRLADFEGRYLCLEPETIRDRLTGTATEMGGFLEAVDTYGWQARLALAAAAGPSGPLATPDWDMLRNHLLDAARGPVDGVLLALHGAMVTQDDQDPEGTLLQALRAALPPGTPIIVTLDMHANVSARMVAHADALFAYETYPHVDHADCARDAAQALARLIALPAHRRATRRALLRPPMLDAADHGRTDPPGPMNQLVAQARALRQSPGVLATALTIGFPWADVAEAGPAVVVTTLADSPANPTTLARPLINGLWDSRAKTQLRFPALDEAMAIARQGRPGDAPLVLADFADNPAGGANGDSPNLLRAMLAAGLSNAAFATLADPQAVRAAQDVGEGASLDLSLGGHHRPDLTPPLHVTARVERLHDGRFRCQGPVLRGVQVEMGPTALLEVDGIRVIVASRALAVTDVNLFHALGLDPARLTTIALKSRNHHRAAFGPLARQVLLVDAGGITTMQLNRITYTNLPRPIWPLDADASPQDIRLQEFAAHDHPAHE
ncbi:MAG: M81 family metallopeptidase [Pararhodobacter sp.]|nr:M81 family metallopeptidase [Pararhodobacter sp.]